MSEHPVLAAERVDDVPLLLHLWQAMRLADLFDQHFPTLATGVVPVWAKPVPSG